MRKTLLVPVILLIFACTASAVTMELNLRADYAGVGNSEIAEYFSPVEIEFSSNLSAIPVGLEFLYFLNENLGVGGGLAVAAKEYGIDMVFYEEYFDIKTLEIFAEAKGRLPLSGAFELYAFAQAGMIMLYESTNTTIPETYVNELSGTSGMFRASAGIAYVMDGFVVGIDAGYKIAELKPMQYKNEYSSGVFENYDGSDARSNFGGFIIGFYLGFRA